MLNYFTKVFTFQKTIMFDSLLIAIEKCRWVVVTTSPPFFNKIGTLLLTDIIVSAHY